MIGAFEMIVLLKFLYKNKRSIHQAAPFVIQVSSWKKLVNKRRYRVAGLYLQPQNWQIFDASNPNLAKRTRTYI